MHVHVHVICAYMHDLQAAVYMHDPYMMCSVYMYVHVHVHVQRTMYVSMSTVVP